MKVSILVIAFLISVPSDWFEKRIADIETIDEKALLRKSTKAIENNSSIDITEYKLNKFRKLRYESSHSESLVTFAVNFYHEGSFLFANDYQLTSDLPRKGVRQDVDPLGTIEDCRIVYRAKDSGLKLKRSIFYFDHSEIDSLMNVLVDLPYDTLDLSSSDYTNSVKAYKRMKSTR